MFKVNPKSQIRNSKQITNSSRTEIKISSGIPLLRENPNVPNSRVWNLENWNLVFRISYFVLRICCLFLIFGVFGCSDKSRQAARLAQKSEAYYQKAVSDYRRLISRGRDPQGLNFALGELYYSHGEFPKAIEALKKSKDAAARRLLALAYFKSGDFTSALEMFSKEEFSDDEYLYYHGLTSEKLNLFDQALKSYAKIKGKVFKDLARLRAENIDRTGGLPLIQDLAPDIYRMISSAPAAENYPQAGGLILLCNEEIEVTPQNTEISSAHILVKILNDRGKRSFSEINIDYDSTYEKVELEFARTIKPDGTVVMVGSRHIRDVSKYLNFPLYSNARAFIISFPEISDGACIEYKFKTFRHELINKKDFVLNYSVQNPEPALDARFTVRLPKGRDLKIKYLNSAYNEPGRDLAPKIREENNYLVYSWVFKDIPQIVPEANMPPWVEINPTFLISSFRGWQDIYEWWWGLARDKIEADSAIKAKVAELTSGLSSTEDKARAIYNFCAQKIRYVAVEYGRAGYEPHPAADVFRNKYGDCKDQVILLVTMFKEVGISAWPVLIPTKDFYNLNPDFPGVFFNHCIALVSLNGRDVFLDPTAETCPFGDLPAGDQLRRVLVSKEDNYQILETPLFPAGHNFLRQQLEMKVSKDGSIQAERVIYSGGIYEQGQRYWLLFTPPELVSEALKQKIQEISIGATLDKYTVDNLSDLNKPLVLRFSFYGPEYLMLAGPLEIMPQLALLDFSLTAKDKRVFPIQFQVLEIKETIYIIELPPGVKVKYFPQSLKAQNQWMDLEVQYGLKNNKIYCYQKTQLKKISISESEYPDFKKFYEAFSRKMKQRVILERKP
jgi:tetratricopeptide (TPR) repeat protein